MPRPATSSTAGSSAKSEQPPNRRPATKVSSNSDGKPSRSEYAKSFAFSPMRLRPKLRNPIPTWGTRNRSDILPSSSANPTPGGGRRIVPPLGRQWPWQERAARSEIFVNSLRSTDTNNNPAPAGRPNGGAGRRGGLQPQHRWPWQRRAQSSGVFLFANDQTTPSTTSTTFNVPVRKWPWAERALKSLIFNQPEEKVTSRRTYKWDQRRTTTPFFEDPATRVATTTLARRKAWPWQEMAKESLIFKPLPPKPPKGILYPWDQRQSDLIFDPNAKFDSVSRYKTEFVKKQRSDGSSIRAAGLRCYKGEIGGPVEKVGLEKRPQEKVTLALEEESNKQLEKKQVENQPNKIKPKQNRVNFSPQTTDNSDKSSSSSADEKENNVPKPQPKKTFTVLQDVSNKVKNVESKSESNLLDQFANMKIKPEKQKVKRIGQIVMERSPKGKVDDNLEVINVQD